MSITIPMMPKLSQADGLPVLFSYEQIQQRVAEMGAAITRDYQGEPVILIGVLKGATIFLSDLARHIDLEATFDFIAVSSYGNSRQSSGEVKNFGWVVPFPRQPVVEKEDAGLFRELFNYVEARTEQKPENVKRNKDEAIGRADSAMGVDVLSRKIVGSYDVAVVRENLAGALDQWLEKEGYQTLGRDAEDVVGFYRRKGYVFACLKVSDAALSGGTAADLHPLRFTFRTGGCDGVYFPMKMTALQKERFDVNLYVFYKAWLNEDTLQYGYARRHFALKYHDSDTAQCQPNAGKAWSDPKTDVFLRDLAHLVPTVTKLFQKLHPGARYYLSNLKALNMNPKFVRAWADDLWLFPNYPDPTFVPIDARPGGVAAAGYATPGEDRK